MQPLPQSPGKFLEEEAAHHARFVVTVADDYPGNIRILHTFPFLDQVDQALQHAIGAVCSEEARAFFYRSEIREVAMLYRVTLP